MTSCSGRRRLRCALSAACDGVFLDRGATSVVRGLVRYGLDIRASPPWTALHPPVCLPVVLAPAALCRVHTVLLSTCSVLSADFFCGSPALQCLRSPCSAPVATPTECALLLVRETLRLLQRLHHRALNLGRCAVLLAAAGPADAAQAHAVCIPGSVGFLVLTVFLRG